MKASATKYGIDEYIYPKVGYQLTLVDQTGCQYNNTSNFPNQNFTDLSEFLDSITEI